MVIDINRQRTFVCQFCRKSAQPQVAHLLRSDDWAGVLSPYDEIVSEEIAWLDCTYEDESADESVWSLTWELLTEGVTDADTDCREEAKSLVCMDESG